MMTYEMFDEIDENSQEMVTPEFLAKIMMKLSKKDKDMFVITVSLLNGIAETRKHIDYLYETLKIKQLA